MTSLNDTQNNNQQKTTKITILKLKLTCHAVVIDPHTLAPTARRRQRSRNSGEERACFQLTCQLYVIDAYIAHE
jgi:hypothetical protein